MSDSSGPYNVFLIGCGAIAGGYDGADTVSPDLVQTHAKTFTLHEAFRVVGCYDPDPEKVQYFAKTWDIKYIATDLETAFRDLKVDVVCICSPTEFHRQQLKFLLDKNVRLVLCEKPLTDGIEGSREIIRQYAECPIALTVNYLRRWNEAFLSLSDRIKSGEFGELQRGTGWYNKGLYNNGSHMVDLFRMFFGDLTVTHAGNIQYDFWPTDPTLNAGLRTCKDKPLHLAGTDVGHFQFFEFRLIMEKAVIDMVDFGNRLVLRLAGPGGMPARKAETIETGRERTFLQLAENLEGYFTRGEALKCPAEDAVKTLEVCAAIRQKVGVSA
ncbi:Gfo/Idh/MocA family oxidoreductase [Emcibacter sp.]|uniref:Gfo/Idh/MocA family protein n=1 Tax=Emcibacter sp. TaxID=1979954 RepID=UPI002AA662FC|nr:Gfo/Idh/MocA family oxidoreductase [Emcibacter sp.]